MLRRLHPIQPESFAFTPANYVWAQGQITKYPAGRQASAVIPLLWRAQEQEGWLSRPAIEHVANMLGMAYIRVLEVATFYFMFQLQPVGSVAHIQICGTTSCMICGAEELIAVCKELISPKAHALSADGKFSWEEVECMGACANAPMAQIGKDYYEDLTADKLRDLIARFSKGEVPLAGPQNGRYASEPLGGLTSLKDHKGTGAKYNGSVQRAVDIGDTVKRIDGTEVPILTPWLGKAKPATPAVGTAKEPKPGARQVADATGVTVQEAPAQSVGTPEPKVSAKPQGLDAPRDGKADDLKVIVGIGPKLEALCHKLGYFHFDQIAAWTPAEIAWVDDNLEGFRGRVTRDNWVAQARDLMAKK
ncbi:NADH-quinone oxidoreductase subunit NuoE [Neogemmobacter tilapiae]|uniref:NADH-quinone oxidoreductase subunit E n=1 Tax=Neogemmobacter tilapiae TaxID=875041 RepID=A0A918WLV2_9RHOB|nr:NADH-quinone oxidoreductase subunit NuoE [Gemmobacter tilapiae]GHC58185.1 NADH-quinone oxidoreductase subunit E [Gemmobacter tilapiae]